MDPNASAAPTTPMNIPSAPTSTTTNSNGTKMALIIGGIVLLIVIGGLIAYKMSQKTATQTASVKPTETPTPQVQAAPVETNRAYSSANDAQVDKDLQDTDANLTALDKDLLSVNSAISDQPGSLSE